MNTAHFSWLPSQLLESAGRLHLQASMIGSSLFSGHFLSWRTGISLEFKEHRDYSEGDDLGKLDWKVLARSDKAMIKTYADEKSLEVIFCIDASKSMDYHSHFQRKNNQENISRRMTKFELARLITAVLGYMFSQNNDSFGAIGLQTKLLPLVELSHKPHRFLHLCSALEQLIPQNVTNYEPLKFLSTILPKKQNNRHRVCFFFSDFLDGPNDFQPVFSFLQNTFQHGFIFHVIDIDEIQFPFEGQIQFLGLESGQKLDLNASVIKKLYKEETSNFFRSIEKDAQKFGLHYFQASNENTVENIFISFLQSWATIRKRK